MQCGRKANKNVYLLEVGAGADMKICDDKTALMFAAQHGQGLVCQILIDHGVKIESADREGMTALSWACQKGKRATAQILLDAGARITHRDRVGRNPMHLAALCGDGKFAAFTQLRPVRLRLVQHATT